MATTPGRSVSLLDEARKPFLEVADKISDALVYLDAAFGEAAYYNLGLSFLYGLGAKAVCALEDASVNDAVAASIGGGSAKLERLVIFTGQLLNDSHRHILRALRAHRDTRKCTIFCALSEAAHADYPGGLLSLDAYSQYEQLLREDLEKSKANSNTQAQDEDSKRKPASRSSQEHVGKEGSGDGWDGWSDEDQRSSSEAGPSGKARTPEGGLGELSRVLREARSSQEAEESWEAGGDEWKQEAENKDELEISVHFFAGLFCSLAPGAFLLPSAAAVTQAPLSSEQSPEGKAVASGCLGRGLPSVGGALGGDEALPAGVSLVAHGLGELLAQLDLKPELFSLGPTSRAVAKAMTELPTVETRRGVGVVLVDRTLDLLTPATHADNFLDRLAAALPQRPSAPSIVQNRKNNAPVWREPLDFRVPLGELFPSGPLMEDDFSKGSKVPSHRESETNGRTGVTRAETPSSSRDGVNTLGHGGQWLGGALFQPSDAQAAERMESFLLRRNSKDALMALRRALQEAVRAEKLPAPRLKLGAIGPSEILALLAPLESQPRLALKHRALIQLARASAHALGAPHGPLWETLASTEKIMALSAAEDMKGLAVQLKELVMQNRTEVERGDTSVIGLRDILALAVVSYSLAGDLSPSSRRSSTGGPAESPFPWEDELALQEAVVDAVLAGPRPTRLGFVDDLEGSLEALWKKRRGDREKEEDGNTDGMERKGKQAEGESGGGEGGGLAESTKSWGEPNEEVEVKENQGGWEDTHDGWDADWGVEEEEPPGTISDEKAYDEVRLRLEVKDRVEEVFGKLRLVAAARQRLHGFQYLDQGVGALGATTSGLLKQLVVSICAREDVPGLEHAASAVKKLLQTGLGRFGFQNFQSGPKLGDCKVVLLFVVGGLTLGEIKDVREALLPPPGQDLPEVIVGGTTLLTPGKVYEELFDKLR